MPHRSSSEAPLTPSWAFVVQLRQGTPLTPQELWGRIEHITSGQVREFHSLAALLAFITDVLHQQEENYMPRRS